MSKSTTARKRYLARIGREEAAAKAENNTSIDNIRYENSIVQCEGLADGRWSFCGMNPEIEREMAREKAVREGDRAAVKELSEDYCDIVVPPKLEKPQKNAEAKVGGK